MVKTAKKSDRGKKITSTWIMFLNDYRTKHYGTHKFEKSGDGNKALWAAAGETWKAMSAADKANYSMKSAVAETKAGTPEKELKPSKK